MASDDGPKRPRARTRRTVSGDEAALFKQAMKDASRLGQGDTPPDAPVPEQTQRRPATRPAGPGPAAGDDRRLPELRAGAPVGLDSRTMDRLKRGRVRPEATLDLHGKTRDEAHEALSAFLARAQGDGKRCIIVVTGKGRLSQGGGVIRAEVPRWLNLAPNRSRVLGFAEAQPRDGGSGALYVLLRRAGPRRKT